MRRKKIHFNLQSSHVLLCGVCLNVDVTFSISNGSKWVGKQWKSQRNGNVWVGALAQWGDLSSFISHQFGVWCRQNARHLLDMSNCTVLKEGNEVKSMQLQPFALTQSINDLLPLNDSSPCQGNKINQQQPKQPHRIAKRVKMLAVREVLDHAFLLALLLQLVNFHHYGCLKNLLLTQNSHLLTQAATTYLSHISSLDVIMDTCNNEHCMSAPVVCPIVQLLLLTAVSSIATWRSAMLYSCDRPNNDGIFSCHLFQFVDYGMWLLQLLITARDDCNLV